MSRSGSPCASRTSRQRGMRPKVPSCTRSIRSTPRPWYRRAQCTTRRRLEPIICLRASSSPCSILLASSVCSAALRSGKRPRSSRNKRIRSGPLELGSLLTRLRSPEVSSGVLVSSILLSAGMSLLSFLTALCSPGTTRIRASPFRVRAGFPDFPIPVVADGYTWNVSDQSSGEEGGASPLARSTMSLRVNESRWWRMCSPTSAHTARSTHWPSWSQAPF